MVPKEVFETFTAEEQRLWRSHDFEMKAGMLAMPKAEGHSDKHWEAAELEAMKEVVKLYSKTWHLRQVNAGHECPLGPARLMGSATSSDQVDLDRAMKGRDAEFGIDYKRKAVARKKVKPPEIHSFDHPFKQNNANISSLCRCE